MPPSLSGRFVLQEGTSNNERFCENTSWQPQWSRAQAVSPAASDTATIHLTALGENMTTSLAGDWQPECRQGGREGEETQWWWETAITALYSEQMPYQQAETKPSDTTSACFEKLGSVDWRSNTLSGPESKYLFMILLYKSLEYRRIFGTWYFLQDLQRQNVLSRLKFAWK